jgi:gliding motility-associated-like protein
VAIPTFINVTASTITVCWSANGNSTTTNYTVNIATSPAITKDLTYFSFDVISASSAGVVGSSVTFTSLPPLTTYYAQVEAWGNNNIPTGYVTLGSTETAALLYEPGPGMIASVSTDTISGWWGASLGASSYTFTVTLSSSDLVAPVFAIPNVSSITVSTTAILSGLPANTTFYVIVNAFNDVLSSTYTLLGSTSTTVATPGAATPALSGVTSNMITTSWTSGGNSTTTIYNIQISTSPGFTTAVPLPISTTSTSVTFTGLASGSTYYAQVFAYGNDGSTTPAVGLGNATTASLSPSQPYGIRGSLSGGNTLTFSWDPVTTNTDGTSIGATMSVNYLVSASNLLYGPFAPPTGSAPTPSTSVNIQYSASNPTQYFTVQTIESDGVNTSTSAYSYILASNVSLDTIITSFNPLYSSTSTLTIPGADTLLLKSFNSFGKDLMANWTEKALSSDNTIIRDVQIDLEKVDPGQPDNGQVVTTLCSFSPASITLNLADSSGSSQLYVFYNLNGNFTDLNGTVNPAQGQPQTISINTTALGEFQIRTQAGGFSSTTLSLPSSNVYPRVITPNGDGINDVVYFVLSNPNNSPVTGTIYDRTGHYVANLANTGGVGGTTLTWDGKDSSGNVVPTGGYLYVIQGEGVKFKGTVAVAR